MSAADDGDAFVRIGDDGNVNFLHSETHEEIASVKCSSSHWHPLHLGGGTVVISRRSSPFCVDVIEWDHDSAKVVTGLQQHKKVVRGLCPFNTRKAVDDEPLSEFVSVSHDRTAVLWDFEHRSVLTEFAVETSNPLSCCYHEEERNWMLFGDFGSCNTHVVDVETNKKLFKYAHGSANPGGNSLWRIIGDPEKPVVYSCAGDNFVCGFDLRAMPGSTRPIATFNEEKHKDNIVLVPGTWQLAVLESYGWIFILDTRKGLSEIRRFKMHPNAGSNAFGLCRIGSGQTNTFVSSSYSGNSLCTWRIDGKLIKKSRRDRNYMLEYVGQPAWMSSLVSLTGMSEAEMGERLTFVAEKDAERREAGRGSVGVSLTVGQHDSSLWAPKWVTVTLL